MNSEHIIKNQLVDYLPKIRQIVYRVAKEQGIVDDITQECCVRLIEKEKLWGGNPNKLNQWINMVTRNLAINLTKKERRRASHEKSFEEENMILPQDEKFSEEHICWVVNQFRHLTPIQKKAIQLRYFEDMKIVDIAKKLNVSQQTASEHIQKALKTLKKRAKSEGLLAAVVPFLKDKILRIRDFNPSKGVTTIIHNPKLLTALILIPSTVGGLWYLNEQEQTNIAQTSIENTSDQIDFQQDITVAVNETELEEKENISNPEVTEKPGETSLASQLSQTARSIIDSKYSKMSLNELLEAHEKVVRSQSWREADKIRTAFANKADEGIPTLIELLKEAQDNPLKKGKAWFEVGFVFRVSREMLSKNLIQDEQNRQMLYEALIEAYPSQDFNFSTHNKIYGLGALTKYPPNRKILNIMMQEMKSPHLQVRQYTLNYLENTLGHLNTENDNLKSQLLFEEGINSLKKIITSESDLNLKTKTAESLFKFLPVSDISETFVDLYESTDDNQIKKALISSSEKLNNEYLDDFIKNQYQSENDDNFKAYLLINLSQKETNQDLLHQALIDDLPRTREVALRRLTQMESINPSPKFINTTIEILNTDTDERIKIAALQNLALFKSNLKDESLSSKVDENLNNETNYSFLKNILDQETKLPEKRAMRSADSLDQLINPNENNVRFFTTSESEDLKIQALEALSQGFQTENANEILLDLTYKDKSPYVRLKAFTSGLKKFKDKRFIPAAINWLRQLKKYPHNYAGIHDLNKAISGVIGKEAGINPRIPDKDFNKALDNVEKWFKANSKQK